MGILADSKSIHNRLAQACARVPDHYRTYIEACVHETTKLIDEAVAVHGHSLSSLAAKMRCNSERWFPDLHDGSVDLVAFYAMGLSGEAGEVLNIVKKLVRKKGGDKAALPFELADAFTYLMLLADELGVDLLTEYALKEKVCESRWG